MSFPRSNYTARRVLLGLALFAAACEGALAQSQIKVLSSRPDSVSGGDAVLQISLPPGVSSLQAVVLRNGVDVSGSFVATDPSSLQ